MWIGACVLVVAGTVGKQALWQYVSGRALEARAKEHQEASEHLQRVYENARKYASDPLTPAELARLRELIPNDPLFTEVEDRYVKKSEKCNCEKKES